MTTIAADDLAGFGPFRGLDRSSRAVIAGWFEPAGFDAGDIVSCHGGDGDGFFILIDGAAMLVDEHGDIRFLSKGDYFGDASALYCAGRTGTVTALTPVTVWAMRRTGRPHVLRLPGQRAVA